MSNIGNEELFKIGFKTETENIFKKKEDIICPVCKNKLVLKTIPGQGKRWAHEKKGKCNLTFLNTEEIKQKEKNLLEELEDKNKEEAKDEIEAFDCEVVEEVDIFASNEEVITEPVEEKKMNMEETTGMLDKGKQETAKTQVDKSRIKRISKESLKRVREKAELDEKNLLVENLVHAEDPVFIAKKEEEIKNKKKSYNDKTEILKKPSYNISFPSITNIATGEVIELNKPSFVVGRTEGDYIIEKSVISKSHLKFITKNDTCYVKDLGSTNGTKVNGFQIPPETEVEIKNGQTLIIADEEFLFTYEI